MLKSSDRKTFKVDTRPFVISVAIELFKRVIYGIYFNTHICLRLRRYTLFYTNVTETIRLRQKTQTNMWQRVHLCGH